MPPSDRTVDTLGRSHRNHLCEQRRRARKIQILPGHQGTIFEAAFGQSEHYTAEDLLDFARAIDDSVSRATVYRTLPIMVESALLREIDIGKNLKYYLPNVEGGTEVAQVICLDCDHIFEIEAPFMEWYGNSVASKVDQRAVSQRLQVSSRCNKLRETGVCERYSA